MNAINKKKKAKKKVIEERKEKNSIWKILLHYHYYHNMIKRLVLMVRWCLRWHIYYYHSNVLCLTFTSFFFVLTIEGDMARANMNTQNTYRHIWKKKRRRRRRRRRQRDLCRITFINNFFLIDSSSFEILFSHDIFA